MIKRLALALLLSTGCGYFKKVPESKPEIAPLKERRLAAKRDGWLAELAAASDEATGWPSAKDCDGTLWAGLAAAGGGKVKLDLAERSPGEIVRSPVTPCTPASRDMVLGYAWGRWAAGDLPALQRLAGYGEGHDWFMSSNHEISYIDPSSQGILARGLDHLSHGADRRGYAKNPLVCVALGKDYEQHLQALDALLAGETTEAAYDINQVCLGVLKEFARTSPDDGLFAAAAGTYTGDMSRAFDLLLDDNYRCPSYVRGAPAYCLVHKIFAARVVLRRYRL